jgi:hypothetical protein
VLVLPAFDVCEAPNRARRQPVHGFRKVVALRVVPSGPLRDAKDFSDLGKAGQLGRHDPEGRARGGRRIIHRRGMLSSVEYFYDVEVVSMATNDKSYVSMNAARLWRVVAEFDEGLAPTAPHLTLARPKGRRR